MRSAGVTAFVVALVAAYGVFLGFSSLVLGHSGAGRLGGLWRRRRTVGEMLSRAGMDSVRPVELLAVEVVLAGVAAAFGYAVYGGWLAASVLGLAAAAVPIATARGRSRARREKARDAWPRMIEEIRLHVVGLGRSVPQALITVGLDGPEVLRPAFAAAQREWLITTDLVLTLDVLKERLADPTADAVCETLLIAHEVGGTDVDARLRALTEDRLLDVQGRRDARSKQAGVRFSRVFVLVVPFGMALVGLSIGDGRAAYASPSGQLAVLAAFALMAVCWVWASHLLSLPEERRVFLESEPGR